jgi:hypothetical protein
MKHITTIEVALNEAENVATVRLSTQSQPIVCGVLGIEGDAGSRMIYLDTRIHRNSGGEFEGWRPRGAISTILEELR